MAAKTLNFNIGILGHVDSGKTSLAKALSTVASTAAFDKNPQSKERGITIDLGFSSFCVDAPTQIQSQGYSKLQLTLVDCPGHASLIRTIIGGAQIIDAMILVVDATKGIQTQTAECIVIGEILCKQLTVVLNKTDLIPKEKLAVTIEKMSKKVLTILKTTKFANCKVVSLAASPGGADGDRSADNIEALVQNIVDSAYVPTRQTDSPLVVSVDHCFGIKGQGTVITGTVLQGVLSVNDNLEIPTLKVSKKVKSMQMFRRPVEKAEQGDRVGICVTQLDPVLLERSLIGASSYIHIVHGFISEVNKIAYYKRDVCSKSKFHISLGHDTVMSTVTFFSSHKHMDLDDEFAYQDSLVEAAKSQETGLRQYALVEFDRQLPLMPNSNFIASKLDMDIHTSSCRIAFWGTVLRPLLDGYQTTLLPSLKVFKNKSKQGTVERMNTDSELIVKNLFQKGTDIQLFSGLRVSLSTGETAIIEGMFGQSGKTKINIRGNLNPSTYQQLKAINDKRKKNKKTEPELPTVDEPIVVSLNFKKYIFNAKKGIIQSK